MEAMVAAAVMAWFGFAAVDPNTPTSWVAGGAALTLLTIAIAFNFRNQLALRDEIKDLKQENRMCRWQTGILVEVLNANEIPVPGNFWTAVPDEVADMNAPERKRSKRFIVGWNEEQGKADGLMLSIILGMLAIVACYTLFLFAFVVNPISDIDRSRKQDSCIASLTADYFGALNITLAAPPAPSQERALAVQQLDVFAQRIRDRVKICEDGNPDPVPTLPSP